MRYSQPRHEELAIILELLVINSSILHVCPCLWPCATFTRNHRGWIDQWTHRFSKEHVRLLHNEELWAGPEEHDILVTDPQLSLRSQGWEMTAESTFCNNRWLPHYITDMVVTGDKVTDCRCWTYQTTLCASFSTLTRRLHCWYCLLSHFLQSWQPAAWSGLSCAQALLKGTCVASFVALNMPRSHQTCTPFVVRLFRFMQTNNLSGKPYHFRQVNNFNRVYPPNPP